MTRVEIVLITGRTIKQGMGLAQGKDSTLYREETAKIELAPEVLAELNLSEGDQVRVETAFGAGVFSCRRGDLPRGVAFIPYGTAANRLTAPVTGGSGMPGLKGIEAWVGRCAHD